MQFILLFGPPAVGKMTVGVEIEKRTGIRLFHNHATIELVLPYFEFGSPPFTRLVTEFRTQILKEVAQSDLPGLTFTYVWDLDNADDTAFVSSACELFSGHGADIALVELYATQDERLIRNRGADRLEAKPSKRNLTRSESSLRHLDSNYRLNTSAERPIPLEFRHLAVDSTSLSSAETAEQIIEHFGIASMTA